MSSDNQNSLLLLINKGLRAINYKVKEHVYYILFIIPIRDYNLVWINSCNCERLQLPSQFPVLVMFKIL